MNRRLTEALARPSVSPKASISATSALSFAIPGSFPAIVAVIRANYPAGHKWQKAT